MGSLFRSASTFERKWTIRLALGGAITCTQHFANERTCTVGVWGLRNYVELCLCEWAAMGDVCRLSWQPSERRAIRRVFFSLPLSSGSRREIVCLSGLSVWKMRDIITSVCRACTRLCWQRPGRRCSQVLWEEALSRHVAFFFLRDCYLSLIYGSNFQRRIGRTGRSEPLLSSVWHHRVG